MARCVGQVLLGLAPLLAAGCLAGYIYPKVTYIPRLDVDAPAQDVWAFAVHSTRERCLSLSPSHEITLRPLPQASTTSIQANLTLEHGYWLWGGMRLSEHVSHDLRVRLYRRGHRTVEIGSWDLFEGVRWLPAASAVELEQAVDDLLAPPREDESLVAAADPFGHLAVGSSDARHQQALRFAALEYETLVRAPGVDDATRTRLAAKVRQLRERADK
jgi:hypothetical protein